jgi:DNA primase
MPGRFFDYYRQVADKIVPFLRGRRVVIEQRFPGSKKIVYRRHAAGADAGDWIRIDSAESLVEWARQYAEAFHAHVRAEDDGAWFVLDIDSRELPTEAAQLGAIYATDVLAEQGLEPLVKFSGA